MENVLGLQHEAQKPAREALPLLRSGPRPDVHDRASVPEGGADAGGDARILAPHPRVADADRVVGGIDARILPPVALL